MTRSAFIQLGVATVALLLAVGAFWQWEGRIYEFENSVGLLENTIQDKRTAITQLNVARTALSSSTEEETILNTYIVSEADIVPFLSAIDATGRAVGAKIVIASVGQQRGVGTRSTLAVAITITGTFNSVMRAVGAIETMPYYLTTDTFTVSNSARTSVGAKKSLWTASLKISVASSNATTKSQQP